MFQSENWDWHCLSSHEQHPVRNVPLWERQPVRNDVLVKFLNEHLADFRSADCSAILQFIRQVMETVFISLLK
jgi:hypothetical protein